MQERISIAHFSRRRLTRDWRILAQDVEDSRISKCTTRRKTFVDEVWIESNIDLQNLVYNSLDFVTGSFYEGQCSKTGMEGSGIYTFPHGVVYEGQFKDGMFHGKGVLMYPRGQSMDCDFHKGKLVKWVFLFGPPKKPSSDAEFPGKKSWIESDSSVLVNTENDLDIATYCKPPDRRFQRSYYDGLKAAPGENLTNAKPIRTIPAGCYDVGDGFYNPKTKWVHRVGDVDSPLYMIPENRIRPRLTTEKSRRKFIEKVPSVPIYKTEKWIKAHCRKAWDEKVGYKPSLYEYWFTGRDKLRANLKMRSQSEGGKFLDEESIIEKSLKCFQENP